MIKQSFQIQTTSARNEEIQIVYNLIFENALYNLECIREGGNFEDVNNYCYAENITEDEGEAEVFLDRMVKGKVFPVHIKDMAKDYFN